MYTYNPELREPARDLRSSQTEAEQWLWGRLRRKQIGGVQFYRQKPIGGFIVDFYCPAVHLIIELDGQYHEQDNQPAHDAERTQQLEALGLQVIRFTNQQVLQDTENVVAEILFIVEQHCLADAVRKSPSIPLLQRGKPEAPSGSSCSPPLQKEGVGEDFLDEHWMRHALTLARNAWQQGEVPVGAVVVRDGVILAEGWNQPITLHDPSAHAEMLALRAAGQAAGNYRLPGTTLYITLEPCLMCVGAMLHARVERVVFGAYDPKTGAAGSAFDLLQDSRHYHKVMAVQGGVLQEECAALLQAFFRERRAAASAKPAP